MFVLALLGAFVHLNMDGWPSATPPLRDSKLAHSNSAVHAYGLSIDKPRGACGAGKGKALLPNRHLKWHEGSLIHCLLRLRQGSCFQASPRPSGQTPLAGPGACSERRASSQRRAGGGGGVCGHVGYVSNCSRSQMTHALTVMPSQAKL